ncbi:type IV secretory system conjugative DNA transfer family protein [Enterococcus hulanensis]|uniref:type IV secretory system conjugative DNA transfer family protein n=1 Tax=Enterococcus hulanensis TaxID=2559929 RepID=UPI0010F530BA|nr:type IV secretory system conjugative DNA transfer family protein [Enterococcus hulanensis]
MKNKLNSFSDRKAAYSRPIRDSTLFKKSWRDPNKKAYQLLERFLGLKRVLIPLLLLIVFLGFVFGNFIISFPAIMSSIFPEGITKPPDWSQLIATKYLFRLPASNNQWVVFLFVFFGFTLLASIRLYKIRRGFMPLEEQLTAATSRWSDGASELDYQYHTMATDNLDEYDGPSGPVVGTSPRTKEDIANNRVREYISDEATNTAVVGETRVGKGIFGIEKAIDGYSRPRDIKKKKSMNLHDPSGELYLKWKKLLEKRLYKVYLLNLKDTSISDSTNPLTLVIHYYKKYLFADKVINRDRGLDRAQAELASLCYTYFHDENAKEPFWQDAASALFTASCLAMIEESILTGKEILGNIYTILNTVAEMSKDRITYPDHPVLVKLEPDKKERQKLFSQFKDKSVLDVYFDSLPSDHPAHVAYQDLLASASAKTTIGNVITHLLTKMKAFRRTGNAKLTALSTINYMDLGFGEQPVAVFVVVSDQDKSNHAIAANYFDQSFKELHQAGLAEPSRRLPRDVVFVYEEAGNMVNIPELPSKVTDGLKVGISHFFVLQNFEQFNKYGESQAETILSNCGNIIALRTKSKKTRESLMDDLGNKGNLTLSRQGKPVESDKTNTESVERIPMVTKDAFAKLPYGQTIVIRSMKTHDLNGEIIYDLYPIFNHDDTRMVPSYMYLPYEDSTWEEIDELYANAEHTKINLKDLHYQFDFGEIKHKEGRRQAISEGKEFVIPSSESGNDQGNLFDTEPDAPSVDSEVSKSVLPEESNEKLQELDEIFDLYVPKEMQVKPITEGLKITFINRISREVRVFYAEKPRIITEFEALKKAGTVKDLRDWFSNVGREPLYSIIIEIIEKEGLM